MYAKHFLKMLLALFGMAIIGVCGLVLANHYAKAGGSANTIQSSTAIEAK